MSANRDAILKDYQWLLSAEAAPWLQRAGQFTDELAAAKSLGGCCSKDRARLVLEQVSLRRKAAKKFSRAGEMFFVSRALEQATDESVASYKAARFRPDELIADLCCGIGGDLMALAARGPVRGVDRDPLCALFAEANASLATRPRNASGVELRCTAAEPGCIADCAAWHIDPDRRAVGRRTTTVELHDPSPQVIDTLLEQNAHGAVKLAPGTSKLPAHWLPSAELEWISRDRQCRQLVAWFGGLAQHSGKRRATALVKTHALPHSFVGTGFEPPDVAANIGRYVFEPDPAVLAAGLEGDLANDHRIAPLASRIPYFTGDWRLSDPLLNAFEVLDVAAYHPRRLRAMLRTRGIGCLEVKKRGVPLDPEAVRRELQVPGDQSATLILTRLERGVIAIVARRLAHNCKQSE